MPSSQEVTPGRSPQARAAVNHLIGAVSLANRFSVMRHGQSKANIAGIIISRIETDRRGDYGLSEAGRRQVLAAARQSGLPRDTVICSSDFARARQTAELVRACLGAREVIVDEALRERCFGDWEGSATVNYESVWAADAAGEGQSAGGVESTASVLDRATRLVADLEWKYSGLDILLVSHGDTLQILQAGFLSLDPSGHRRLPHLATGEIRRLRLGERVRPSG
jgi:broad specificity phosphatase PhoE